MIRRVARRALRRYDIVQTPAPDAGFVYSLCRRRDYRLRFDPNSPVPGVWITVDRAIGVDDVWDMIHYYIRYFEQQPWERGRSYE